MTRHYRTELRPDDVGEIRRIVEATGFFYPFEVDVAVEQGTITGYGHQIAACALGQTSAAIVARRIVGTPVAEFRAVREQMTAMLKSDGAPPAGKWSDLAYLEPVRDYSPRHTSTLLVFDAVADALDKIDAGQTLTAAR